MLAFFFHTFIFPGFLFQFLSGWFFEWFDRKLLARYQRRVGPRWYQPFADLLKLFSKEDLIPTGTPELVAAALPIVSLCAVLTAGMYVPVAGFDLLSFEGDLIIVLFLLSLPTLAYYLAGTISVGIYSVLGGARSVLQYFSYEIPLLIALSGPAVLAGSWSIQGIVEVQNQSAPFFIFQPVGFLLAIIGLIGKLKRDPLDIPKAKSEVVGGSLTEFTGTKLAFWHTVLNIQTVVGIFLIINLYLCFGECGSGLIGGVLFFIKFLGLAALLSTVSSLVARLRIDQLSGLGWKVLAPLALLQLIAVILMGV
ncbi:MAG: complex I subunit 1 family protein [Anaerolineae bacterium]|jgi:NADH-quinone oxidoreductase subunit H|nr:complex I subunit 1 family protein [Anaerolineae bacterium]